MDRITELMEKRAQVWNTARKFLDAHEGGTLSAEDTATYDRMEAEIVDLGKAIDRENRLQSLERQMAQPTSSPLNGKPGATGAEDKKNPRATAEYKSSFWNMMRSRGAVMPEVTNALRIGEDTEGGYLVPDEFEHTLIEALEEENIFRSLAHVIQTSSGDRKIPVSASKGEAAWMDEGAAFPESDDKFDQVSIGAHKVGTLIKVSDELINDSVFDIEAYISREFGRRIGTKEEEAFISGDGKGKPLGILDATEGAQVGVTAAAEGAVTADELMDLFYSLKAPYRKKAGWLLNDTTIKAIRKLKDNNGNYLWQPALTAGQPDLLLSRPLKTSAFMPTLAAGARTILFGDYSYYWIADRQGRSFKRLSELYAPNGQVGFLASQRVDGRLVLPEAVKVLIQKAAA